MGLHQLDMYHTQKTHCGIEKQRNTSAIKNINFWEDTKILRISYTFILCWLQHDEGLQCQSLDQAQVYCKSALFHWDFGGGGYPNTSRLYLRKIILSKSAALRSKWYLETNFSHFELSLTLLQLMLWNSEKLLCRISWVGEVKMLIYPPCVWACVLDAISALVSH